MRDLAAVVATLVCCVALAAAAAAEQRRKVALCFFGLVKNTTELDMANYESAIIKPLRKAGYDVEGFMHTYKLSMYGNKRNNEAATGLRTAESIEMWRSLIPFRAVDVTEPDVADRAFCPMSRFFAHGDPWMDNPVVSVVYFLRQQYSLWRVTRALRKHDNDFVGAIYLRPDVRFLDELQVDVFDRLVHTSTRAIAVPVWHSWHGFNDRLAFGKTADMIVYGQRMTKLADYTKNAPPHAERFLHAYLNESGIAVEGLWMRFQRVRTDGSIEDADKELEKQDFRKKRRKQRGFWSRFKS